MLTKILIKNFTLIDKVEIDFLSGFTTVTGDTGSGKSILLSALSLIIGKRAGQNLLKNSTLKCVLEAEFNLSNFNIRSLLVKNNIDYFDQTILRREILPNGKSRSFVNDSPVNLDFLKTVGEKLIDIHTQHQPLASSNNSFFYSLIDNLAEQQHIVKNFNDTLINYKDLKIELQKLIRLNTSLKNDNDYLLYLYNELNDIKLVIDEQEILENKLKLFKNSEEIKSSFSQIEYILYSSDDSIENKIFSLNSVLHNISKISDNFSQIKNRLDSLLIELNDIKSDLNNSSLDFSDDDSEIDKMESRLNIIYNLQKKHSVNSISALIIKKQELKSKLDESGSVEINIDELQKTISKKTHYLQELSKKISISRKKIIPKLKLELESLLLELGMKNASFDFKLSEIDDFNRYGSDQIEVLFSANKGIEYAPLFKIASGGELSRILLSIKSILSKHLNLPTMIFDEIDSGVSGEMSNAMANMMLEMSSKMQIIAITHLPQVASKGNHQLSVYKQNSLSSTSTMVKQLNNQERIDEIAKMLAGDLISDSAITHAKELLN
ncbi:DNA repair protein RecN [Flavobacteriaceae bacterium]|nr:DNA repair protein RecN [Flavobacteriaceae bacterium]MDB0069548.1 DNA repair protein RecN [Flavobacteriaceae bacterium]MDB4092945.1 DNA repair protein RecN [Flavobacteriaceae bacterium]MDC1456818.1 DNA repair protein RecN [Flavobacteriaceae bacterium]